MGMTPTLWSVVRVNIFSCRASHGRAWYIVGCPWSIHSLSHKSQSLHRFRTRPPVLPAELVSPWTSELVLIGVGLSQPSHHHYWFRNSGMCWSAESTGPAPAMCSGTGVWISQALSCNNRSWLWVIQHFTNLLKGQWVAHTIIRRAGEPGSRPSWPKPLHSAELQENCCHHQALDAGAADCTPAASVPGAQLYCNLWWLHCRRQRGGRRNRLCTFLLASLAAVKVLCPCQESKIWLPPWGGGAKDLKLVLMKDECSRARVVTSMTDSATSLALVWENEAQQHCLLGLLRKNLPHALDRHKKRVSFPLDIVMCWCGVWSAINHFGMREASLKMKPIHGGGKK